MLSITFVWSLLQVRGTCDFDTRAVQVPEVAGSLNADDAFVLETPGKTYLWIGKVWFTSSKYFFLLILKNKKNSIKTEHINVARFLDSMI